MTDPTPLIVDSDLDTDCDDAAALAVMHRLADDGRCEPLGVVCSAPVAACAAYASHVNRAYGRPSLPVAAIDPDRWADNPMRDAYVKHRGAMGEQGRLYVEAPEVEPADPGALPEAVALYRRLLAAPGPLRRIAAIGTLTALAALLDSEPDAHSPLPGHELVRRRVELLVTMARGHHPAGRDGFNWRMDPAAAHAVLTRWPTPLHVQPQGADVLTGRGLHAHATTDPRHPVAMAYRRWLGPDADPPARASWDPLTVWAAVDPTGPLWHHDRGEVVDFDPATNAYRWHAPGPDDAREHVHLRLTATPEDAAARIDALIDLASS
jgi:hypothetical protein